MKCPFKFGRYAFEGGEECDPECAWRVGVEMGAPNHRVGPRSVVVDVCAMALAGSVDECPRRPRNWEDRP